MGTEAATAADSLGGSPDKAEGAVLSPTHMDFEGEEVDAVKERRNEKLVLPSPGQR